MAARITPETCTSRAYTESVSRIPAGDDVLDPDEPTYDLPGVAELLGIPVTKVHQHLREGHLVAVRRAGDVLVPRVFFTDSGLNVSTVNVQTTVTAVGAWSVSNSTGTYTFSSADHTAGVQVVISYAYFETTAGNRITAVNQLMGASPTFRMQLGNNYAGNNMSLTLYAAIPTKMSSCST